MMKKSVLVAALLVVPVQGIAQDEPMRIPTIPAGVPAVFLPVQDTRPTAGGAWLAGSVSDRDAVELLDAELAFAFGEERGAESWALPDDVRRRLARNPTIKIDPSRLAYHGMLARPEPRAQIYEPLHTQLRQIAALFNARIVILPLVAYYLPVGEEDRLAAEEAGEEPPLGRAVLLTAVIDIRRSAVLWHGEIQGERAEAVSREALTTLALAAARWLAPS
ncbi:MAG: hypothetical protein R3195_08730 [Gemmatimonadota bacterium]|nr:hypothetical protein [Gemmatimonadota bacterium]